MVLDFHSAAHCSQKVTFFRWICIFCVVATIRFPALHIQKQMSSAHHRPTAGA